jgi:hypothetical protein
MGKSRKVSSISKEFDGKEVQGKLIKRAGLFGSNVSKEVFKMPGGGKHIEKTRTNKKGDVVSRMSKDTKVNPLAFFNKNKTEAYKKAGGAITAYKKSLKKAQDGIETNSDLINKAGSKGGYKKSLQKDKPWEGPVDLITPKMKTQSISPNDPYERYRADALNELYPNFQIDPSSFSKPKALSEKMSKIKQKTGGSVKRKK